MISNKEHYNCPYCFIKRLYRTDNNDLFVVNVMILMNILRKCSILINILLNILDINECISNPCNTNARCENCIGSYTCECKEGFSGDGTSCTGNFIIDNYIIYDKMHALDFLILFPVKKPQTY